MGQVRHFTNQNRLTVYQHSPYSALADFLIEQMQKKALSQEMSQALCKMMQEHYQIEKITLEDLQALLANYNNRQKQAIVDSVFARYKTSARESKSQDNSTIEGLTALAKLLNVSIDIYNESKYESSNASLDTFQTLHPGSKLIVSLGNQGHLYHRLLDNANEAKMRNDVENDQSIGTLTEPQVRERLATLVQNRMKKDTPPSPSARGRVAVNVSEEKIREYKTEFFKLDKDKIAWKDKVAELRAKYKSNVPGPGLVKYWLTDQESVYLPEEEQRKADEILARELQRESFQDAPKPK